MGIEQAILWLLHIIVSFVLHEVGGRLHQLWQRLRKKPLPQVPEYENEGKEWRKQYISRVAEYVNQNLNNLGELGLGLNDKDYLSPSTALEQSPLIDCICSALECKGRVYLILPSAGSWPDIEGVGRTALITRLLNLRPPYTKFIGFGVNRSVSNPSIDFPASNTWKLISSDIAYLGVYNGRLHVVSIKGEKVNFLWDLARHIFRSTDLSYTSGAHRTGSKREQLEELFIQMPCTGLSRLYVKNVACAYPVDEVLLVERRKVTGSSMNLRRLFGRKPLKSLKESILVSSESHGSPFWMRSRKELKPFVHHLFYQVPSRKLPLVKKVIFNSQSGDVPGFLYDEVVQAINNSNNSKVPTTINKPKSEVGLLLGIVDYNRELFNALNSADQVKMLVISGEKVFHDGAFWRRLAQLEKSFKLEILMVDPDSELARELENESYNDKKAGFLLDEIGTNLQAIRNAKTYFESKCPQVFVDYKLYKKRQNLRITLIYNRQNRAIIAHYIPGSRTGPDTLFFDLHSSYVSKFVDRINQHYEKVKHDTENR